MVERIILGMKTHQTHRFHTLIDSLDTNLVIEMEHLKSL